MNQNRLTNIDGLRGLASILVLVQHLCEHYSALSPTYDTLSRSIAQYLLSYCDLGKVGVVAFFAISGFVVPYSFKGDRPRLSFIISRFFRLYPAYWISLATAVILLPHIGDFHFSFAQIGANVTMLQTAFRQQEVLGVYWTLFIEITFYTLCFFMFSVGKLYSARSLLAAFLASMLFALFGAILRSRGHSNIPAALPLYLSVMWFGTCLRLSVLSGDALAARLVRPMIGILAIVIPIVWCTAYNDDSHRESVLADISAFYLAIALFLICVYRRVLGGAALVWFGSISYSLYLLHPIALDIGTFAGRRSNWPLGGAVLVATTLALSIFASWVVYRYVERPLIKLGHRALSLVG